ncbi:amino acid permease, partial [Methylobacterium sp. J-048]|uniref:APC family permease n=1 Tax=Methylobacterium sp. J-048 TaxID=2836635 RepID=UPI001FBB4040
PYRELDVADPIAKAIDRLAMPGLAIVIKIGALIGLTTSALTALYGQGRIFFAIARDGLLPPLFCRVDPATRAPVASQVVIGLFTAALAGLVPIDILGELVSIGTLLAFSLVCGLVLILRRTEPDRPRPFRVPAAPLMAALGILSCLVLMASLPADTWVRLAIWLVIGLAIYAGYGRRHARLTRAG